MKETFYEPWDLTTQFSLLISITKLLRVVIDENAICCLNSKVVHSLITWNSIL